ncbi:TetR family transcriptional regulator [Aquipuribacter nitratireducens]|uniref:TetR family transcriptional regulator n=1 Tax=Aquipuribacter nitratireducens TaxID=650104 RepID=A0ABW0GRW1_9MICO
MGHRLTREDVVDAAVRAAVSGGLSSLSFRTVAAEAGTSDRMVVYYLPDKATLLTAVLTHVGERLRGVLAASLPEDAGRGLRPHDVLRASRPVFTDPANGPVLRLFLEAVGLGAARVAPFDVVVPQLLAGWVAWLEPHMGPTAAPGSAAATVATVDGLLIVSALLGEDAGRAAWDAVLDGATTRR